MVGAVIIVIVIVIVLPIGFMMAGGVLSGIFGWLLQSDAEKTGADSPYLDLNQ